MAYNSRNLTYNDSEPAFLQRLKAGYAAQDGRNNVQHARPSKSRLRMGDGDEDDGPVILDETGQVVDKHVYDEMVEKGGNHPGGGRIEEKSDGEKVAVVESNPERQSGRREDGHDEREKQKVAEVGATKKRKAIKVVGEDENAGNLVDDARQTVAVTEKPNRKLTTDKKDEAGASAASKVKKKAKKIKLSFEDAV